MPETVVSTCEKNRGRHIRRETVVRLVAAAAGHCASPLCTTGFLWHELADGSAVRLGEVAHIVAAQADGPRGDPKSLESDLVAFDNLVLLCLNCHTIVDRAPDEYPVETLRQWKAHHEARILEVLGVVRYTSRQQAQAELRRLLQSNRVTWERYGPESPDAWTPESASTWLREVRDVVLPNNTSISKLLDVNSHLLRSNELSIVAEFSTHARALEQRHLTGVVNPSAPRFPKALDNVFSD
ncbi:hypothetical protein [Streptomyces sp. NPDC042319]|uniref:hypothetical protein n=1 Tax=Streptomyces sp. NPDC042319 TaxID=3154332 RepID=UPI00340333E9